MTWTLFKAFRNQNMEPRSKPLAEVRADGRVVTWGNPDAGGDSSGVQEQLVEVRYEMYLPGSILVPNRKQVLP